MDSEPTPTVIHLNDEQIDGLASGKAYQFEEFVLACTEYAPPRDVVGDSELVLLGPDHIEDVREGGIWSTNPSERWFEYDDTVVVTKESERERLEGILEALRDQQR